MQLYVGAKGIVEYDGKILLLRESLRYKDRSGEVGKWDVPGGRINPEETVYEGLIREVKEESGLSIVPGKVLGVFDGFPEIHGERVHVVRIYFVCTATDATVILSEDHDDYAWIDPVHFDEYLLKDDIEEVLTSYPAPS